MHQGLHKNRCYGQFQLVSVNQGDIEDILDHLAQALGGFTRGAAYAAFVEGRRGIIAPGYDADLTIVEGPGLAELATAAGAAEALLHARVRATVVAGRIVYERPAD